MNSYGGKEDLRITKTDNALTGALVTLLENRRFSQLTVNALCKEAEVSRAAFYAHFSDKYDLLRFWFTQLNANLMLEFDVYLQMEKTVNHFFRRHSKVFLNLLSDMDFETMKVFCDCWLCGFRAADENDKDKGTRLNHIVFSSFYVGGLIYYLMWHVKNRFPPDVEIMNPEVYEILQFLTER